LSGLPHAVSDSAAYLSLTPFERAVFGEILRRFNGYNNGAIGITYAEIGERLKGSNKSLPNNHRIALAIVALFERGLIAEPTAGSWSERLAREYRITFIGSGKGPPFRPATNEYLQWSPTKKNVGDVSSPDGPVLGDAGSPEASSTGDAGSPENLKNGSFACLSPGSSGDAGSLLILEPSQGTPFEDGEEPDLSPKIAVGRRAPVRLSCREAGR
jgi:hypothetical protein